MRKKILFIFVCLAGISCQQPSDRATLEGSVDSYQGEGYLICMINTAEGRRNDTIPVQQDGKFEYSTSLEKPTAVYLFLEYLKDDATLFQVYMANGTTSKVKITGARNEAGKLVSTAEFSGKHKAESEYLDAYLRLISLAHPDLGLGKAAGFKTFKEYQSYVKEILEPLRTSLNQAKDADFKAANMEVLNREERTIPFRFAWAKRQNGERMDEDADFVAYVKSFDVNDPESVQITGMVLRWYLGCEENPKNESSALRQMRLMKQMITNQDIINRLSKSTMESEMSMGGSKDLPAIYELYKQTTTDMEALEKITIMYDQLTKLAKGTPAFDFEMQDVQGKTVRFLSVIGKGKVVYIDFWATWCGTCKQEIPHMEKLAETYKENPNIEILSISLDNKISSWHAKLEEDKPTWRQYIIPDNFNSVFAKQYNIQAIPRFMAFDKKGRIIDINAPRPSDPNIHTFLEACMK